MGEKSLRLEEKKKKPCNREKMLNEKTGLGELNFRKRDDPPKHASCGFACANEAPVPNTHHGRRYRA